MNAPKPVRLQRSRKKGAKLVSPNGLPIVCVSRPSKWGNPWRVGRDGDRGKCVEKYRKLVTQDNIWTHPNRRGIKAGLRGKNLACWCPIGQPCHADVLLELANKD